MSMPSRPTIQNEPNKHPSDLAFKSNCLNLPLHLKQLNEIDVGKLDLILFDQYFRKAYPALLHQGTQRNTLRLYP
jgi:hypothetical protein